jgi:hypothetical protein
VPARRSRRKTRRHQPSAVLLPAAPPLPALLLLWYNTIRLSLD